MLSLNADRLNAFYQVILDRHFTRAAATLCITQSALSQRIQRLEEDIETTLIIRRTDGVEPTAAGRLLFDFIQHQIVGEGELLRAMKGHGGVALGTVRIAAYSSVLRSVIMPAVRPLLIGGAPVSIEFFCREYRELPGMLKSGEADFVVHEAAQKMANCTEVPLGRETLVHVRNRESHARHDEAAIPVFLDHDMEDMTTYRFFEAQGEPEKEFYRSFYDDVYGLLDGVKLGFGEAILSEHLARDEPALVVIAHPNPVEIPFSLYYSSSKLMTRLHKSVVKALVERVPTYL